MDTITTPDATPLTTQNPSDTSATATATSAATSTTSKSKLSKGWLISGLIVWLLGGFYGAYLSWSCNSNHGFGTVSKVCFAFCAMLGGWGYVLSYLFYKSGTCDPVASLLANPDAAARFLKGHTTMG